MGADMLIATIATPAGVTPDFDAGRTALQQVEDVDHFSFDYNDEAPWLLGDDFDENTHVDADGKVTLDAARQAGRIILDDLERALDSHDMDVRHVGGYDLYLTGGLSWGDAPTDEAETIGQVEQLPAVVLAATGLVLDYAEPPSRRDATTKAVTDTDVVDAIALGLGTQSDWSGGDCLEWVANAVGLVREHPGDAPGGPVEYLSRYVERHGIDPRGDHFLAQFVDDEAG